MSMNIEYEISCVYCSKCILLHVQENDENRFHCKYVSWGQMEWYITTQGGEFEITETDNTNRSIKAWLESSMKF